jgi:hypothetical protein
MTTLYRKLALTAHPDKPQGSTLAMTNLSKAYQAGVHHFSAKGVIYFETQPSDWEIMGNDA